MNLTELRQFCIDGKVLWSIHGLERIQERDITVEEVIQTIMSGEIIENYPDDYPHPSCLLLRFIHKERPIHVVAACGNGFAHIITAYIPSPEYFESDMKTRRKKS